MSWLEPVAWAAAAVVSVPLAVLAVECLVAAARRPTAGPPPTNRPRCAVLVPAHDEEAGIVRTLASLRAQLAPGDRVLVVADNCSDETAAVARRHGAEAVERCDPDRRGKGYALAFGLDVLAADPPAVVVVLDADCVLADGALARLVGTAAGGRPAQGCVRMAAPPGAGPDRRVAAFAYLVKNFVRPLGLLRLGRPCLLAGTGMAFPWAVIKPAKLGHGHIVEDTNLAVDLAVAGHPTRFVLGAEIGSEFPVGDRAAGVQRRRWEHGHLRMLRSGVPRLAWAGLTRGSGDLLALALELGVPPLSALAVVTAVVVAALTGLAAVGGAWGPVALLGGTTAAATAAVGLAWWRFGRPVLPPGELARVPLYVARKVPLYVGFLFDRESRWVRTQRDPVSSEA